MAGKAIAALTVALAGFLYRYLTYNGFSNDHFVHLSAAQQITMGELPVRDFVERGLPLMSAVSAAAQVMFGPGLHAELLLISGAFALAAVCAFFAAARLSGSTVAGLAAGALTLLAFPATYGYPKMLVYGAVFLAAATYAHRPDGRRLTGLAAATAVAFLFRHDHGVLLGLGAIVLVWGRHGIAAAALRRTGAFVALTLVFLLPYLAWAHVHAGLLAYAGDGVAFTMREAERATWWDLPRIGVDRARPLFTRAHGPVVNVRWRPELSVSGIREGEQRHSLVRLDAIGPHTWQYELRQWSFLALRRLVRDPAVADTHGIDRQAYRLTVASPSLLSTLVGHYRPAHGLKLRANGVALMFYFLWLVPLLMVALLVGKWQRLSPPLRAFAVMAVAVQLAMNLTMLRDPLDSRVRDVVMPLSLLMTVVASVLWQSGGGAVFSARTRSAILVRRAMAAALVALLVLTAAAAGPLDEHLADLGLSGSRGFARERLEELRADLAPPHERTGRGGASSPLVEYIRTCTAPRSRILAMTFAPELFFYSGRAFAGGQVALPPGYFVGDRHASLMLERLAREDVPLVILDSETSAEMAVHYPRVMAHVTARYREAGRFAIGPDKDFIVLVEAARRSSRTVSATLTDGASPSTGSMGSDLPCFTTPTSS